MSGAGGHRGEASAGPSLMYATCIAIDGAGVLIRGPSGAGKSDLALRMIDGGARLVADDQVALAPASGTLLASAPAALAGRLEVRGLGIAALPALKQAPVVLLVDLVADGTVERMPVPSSETLLGITLPRLALAPFEASAPAKLRLAAEQAKRDSTARQ